MCERWQRVLPISNAQAIVSTINGVSVAIGVVDLVDDLSVLFGPETETFNCNAVDQEKIVADEAYGRSFGTVGKASGEVPENWKVSGLLFSRVQVISYLNTRLDSFTAPVSGVNVLCQY